MNGAMRLAALFVVALAAIDFLAADFLRAFFDGNVFLLLSYSALLISLGALWTYGSYQSLV